MIILALTNLNIITGKPRRADFNNQDEEVILFAEGVLRSQTVEEIETHLENTILMIEDYKDKRPKPKKEKNKFSLFSKKKSVEVKQEPEVDKEFEDILGFIEETVKEVAATEKEEERQIEVASENKANERDFEEQQVKKFVVEKPGDKTEKPVEKPVQEPFSPAPYNEQKYIDKPIEKLVDEVLDNKLEKVLNHTTYRNPSSEFYSSVGRNGGRRKKIKPFWKSKSFYISVASLGIIAIGTSAWGYQGLKENIKLKKENAVLLKQKNEIAEILEIHRQAIINKDGMGMKLALKELESKGYKNLHPSDQRLMILLYDNTGNLKKAFELEPSYTDEIIEHCYKVNNLEALDKLQKESPNNISLKFEIASINNDFKTILELQNKVVLNDRRIQRIIDAYIGTGNPDGGKDWLAQKNNAKL